MENIKNRKFNLLTAINLFLNIEENGFGYVNVTVEMKQMLELVN